MPIVEDVVRKAAEENPQKLRQIGLNYDIAHAKGGFEEEEEERKKKLEKEKEVKEENMKKKLEAEKPETEEAGNKKVETTKMDGQTAEDKKVESKLEAKDEKQSDGGKGQEGKSDAETSHTEVANESGTKGDVNENEVNAKKEVNTKEEEKVENKDEGEHPSNKKLEADPNDGEAKPKSEDQPEPDTESAAKESSNPWNAVAVIGLRVYSKDPTLTITLVKPKDPEEAAILDVDGVSGAGATT